MAKKKTQEQLDKEEKEGPGFMSEMRHIDKQSIAKVKCMLRFFNVLNAAVLIAGGALVFVPPFGPSILSPGLVICGLYIILFSCLLCCFEVHLKRMDKYIFLNCGFMFHWAGRFLFFFFCGTLSFTLGVIGIVAGIFTILNLMFTFYVLRYHPTYRQYMLEQSREFYVHTLDEATMDVEKGEAGEGSTKKSGNDDSGGSAWPQVGGELGRDIENARKVHKFAKEHKEEVAAAQEFYGDHKEECNAAAAKAYEHRESIGKAAEFASKHAK